MKKIYLAILALGLSGVFPAIGVPAIGEDVKLPAVDMTTVLMDRFGKPIKDCPSGYKGDGTDCPDLTLSAAANYAVGFASEQDRTMDWHERARLRRLLGRVSDQKAAVLTHAEADGLMNQIGALYKLLQRGDETIVAAMKVLQPAEYDKLDEAK